MDVPKFKDGIVHFRNSGMKGLNTTWKNLSKVLSEHFGTADTTFKSMFEKYSSFSAKTYSQKYFLDMLGTALPWFVCLISCREMS